MEIENFTKEPTLEEYGLNISSYIKHREHINGLIDLEKSLSFSFWKYLFVLPLPALGILYFFLNVNIILAIFLSLFSLLFFEIIRDYVNNNSSDYKEAGTRLSNYKKESRVGDFESALFDYYHKEIENYYKFYVFRKRCGREGGLHLAHLIKEESNISNFIYNRNGSCNSGYNEYLGKRFSINPNYVDSDSNYFKFTDIINKITGKPISNLKNGNVSLISKVDTINSTKEVKKRNVEDLLADLNKKTKEDFNNLKQTEIKELSIVESPKVEKKSFWDSLMADVKVEIEEVNNPSIKSESMSEKVKEVMDIINVIPPEKLYRTPRKIDWEKVNKTKVITGMKGEEIVMAIEQDYLKSINREDLAEKVEHISKERGDGSGYDILSFFPSGEEKYIEVKSTIKSGGNSFYLSNNELEFLKRNKYRVHIYRLFNVNDNDEAPSLRVHSAEDILKFNQITPIQYVVKME